MNATVPHAPTHIRTTIATALVCVWGLAVLAFSGAIGTPAHAIIINIEYSTDFGGDESPSWDSNGAILTAHLQAAKAIWESLLLGPEEYTFDFQWDNDLGAGELALTTESPLDTYMEFNPNVSWYADPTPMDHNEFTFADRTSGTGAANFSQQIFNQLSTADRSTYFPGTAPPGTLEVMYRGFGSATAASTTGAAGVTAATGNDLLSTALHEIGHILGISGTEPGDYNIYPHHVGGLEDVLVSEAEGGPFESHLAGTPDVPGFLMCGSCGRQGVRRLPTATDVLVIAEDQGITDVHLARVHRISSGLWSNTNAWIGGDVPDATQDVYLAQGGAVTLDTAALARNLSVSSGSVAVGGQSLTASGALTLAGGNVSVGAGGSLSAVSITGSPSSLTTTAGSLVRFNNFLPGTSTATAVTFNGSASVGFSPTGGPIAASTFDPTSLATWTIADEFAVGDPGSNATLIIDNGMDITSVRGRIGSAGGQGHVMLTGPGSTWTMSGPLVPRGGSLLVSNSAVLTTGSVTLDVPDHQMLVTLDGGTWDVNGDLNILNIAPPPAVGTSDARLHVKNSSTVDVDGNLLIEGAQKRLSQVIVGSNSALNVVGGVAVRRGGVLTFQDGVNILVTSTTFENVGTDTPAAGGRTELEGNVSARNATFTNRGGTYENGMTLLKGNATAEDATFDNLGGEGVFAPGGATQFYDNATAARGTFINHGNIGPSSYNGTTRFYGSSTAAFGTFLHRPGTSFAGRTEFYGTSTAANGMFVLETAATGRHGGSISFRDASNAGQASFIIEPEANNSIITFYHFSSAAQATFLLSNLTNGRVEFHDDATAGLANFDIGRFEHLRFLSRSTAADATVRIREQGLTTFNGEYNDAQAPTTTAGNATFTIDGGSVPSGMGGSLGFSTWATASNATIDVKGAGVATAFPGRGYFDYGGQAGNSTIILNSGVDGGAGGELFFVQGGNGGTARVVAEAGSAVHVSNNETIYGPTTLGSIEGAGQVLLHPTALLAVGGRNTSTTFSGTVRVNPSFGATGGRLSKVGTGNLPLAGNNTYTGLTTVDGGTLSITGSILGDVEVNDGGRLEGTGNVGGRVTVNPGGHIAPGASPGTLTVGGLTMTPDSFFDFDLGTTRDHIVLTGTGDVVLDGILKISLLDGFVPTAGNTFPLLEGSIGTISGMFDRVIAPVFNGQTLHVNKTGNSVVLYVDEFTGLSGDYNADGAVDSADYTVWRDNLGAAAGTLLNDPNTGVVGSAQYNTWKTNFGATQSSNLAASSVPEPGTLLLLLAGVLASSHALRFTR